MDPESGDYMENIEYILETGAGWSGPIKRGYVIFRFPYEATKENVLSDTTAGYQYLYNEIFWSFENLEPTSENNIQISIVSPSTWQQMLSLRRDLNENPALPEKWLRLAEIYEGVAIWKALYTRSYEYFEKVFTAYEQGISANPNNAELYARYAQYKLYNIDPRLLRQLTLDEEDKAGEILALLNKALALDPNNETANQTLSELMYVAPFITFTPPLTIPPTATSKFTATPSITPSATITPVPSETPIVVTVVHTKIVNAPTFTKMPQATETLIPIGVEPQAETQEDANSSTIIFGALLVFGLGAGSGWLLSKRQKK
jgi:tetratricopeptide (TPR) repeat protein